MNGDVYRFQIGDFQCTAISDGTLTYAPPTFPPPAALLFTNAPQDTLDAMGRSYNLQAQDWRE